MVFDSMKESEQKVPEHDQGFSGRLRVLAVINNFARGGAEEAFASSINYLQDKVDFRILTLYPTSEANLKARQFQIPIWNLNLGKRLVSISTLVKWLKILPEIRRWKPDIIHSRLYAANVIGACLKRCLPKVRLITTAGGSHFWFRWYHRMAAGFFYGQSSVVMVNTQALKIEVSKYQRAGKNIHVIPNGLNLPADEKAIQASSISLPAGKIVVGCIGRFVPEKGYDKVLEAAYQLKNTDPRFHFLLVGGRGLFTQTKDEIHRLGLEDMMTLTGEVPSALPYLKRMDIFLMASSSEGMPHALMEAMWFAKPVVATRVGGIPELVDENNGVLIEPGSTKAIVSALQTLADSPDLCRKFSINNREKIRSYSLPAMAGRVKELYYAVMASEPGERPQLTGKKSINTVKCL